MAIATPHGYEDALSNADGKWPYTVRMACIFPSNIEKGIRVSSEHVCHSCPSVYKVESGM